MVWTHPKETGSFCWDFSEKKVTTTTGISTAAREITPNSPHWYWISDKVISQQRTGAAYCLTPQQLEGEQSFHSLFSKSCFCQGKGLWSIFWPSVKEGGVCYEKGAMRNQNQSNHVRTVLGGVLRIMRDLSQNSFQCNELWEKYLMRTPVQQNIKWVLNVKLNIK